MKSMSTGKIALLFVGSMIGAGFASGKEAWQFFGVFGIKGLAGIALAVCLYCLLGYISVSIASKLNSADIAAMVCPVENAVLKAFIGIMMCAFLLVAYVAMLAAGGALVETSVGLPHQAGSFAYMLLAVITALGGFEKVASRIGKVAPILVAGTLAIGLFLIFQNPGAISQAKESAASPFASHWVLAAIGYVGYNMTAAVPVLGQCALRAKNIKAAQAGALVGGVLLGLCSIILFFATLQNPALSSSAALPMLSFATEISALLGNVYALFLLIAIFGAATTCFYGFTTKLGSLAHRSLILWAVGLGGYLLSLYGFSNFVANVYPVVGYVSVAFFIMEIWNFIRLSGRHTAPRGKIEDISLDNPKGLRKIS